MLLLPPCLTPLALLDGRPLVTYISRARLWAPQSKVPRYLMASGWFPRQQTPRCISGRRKTGEEYSWEHRGRAGGKLNWAKGTNGLQCKVHPPSLPRPQPTLQGTLKLGWPFRVRPSDQPLYLGCQGKGMWPWARQLSPAESVPEKGGQLKAVSQEHSQHLGVKSSILKGNPSIHYAILLLFISLST